MKPSLFTFCFLTFCLNAAPAYSENRSEAPLSLISTGEPAQLPYYDLIITLPAGMKYDLEGLTVFIVDRQEDFLWERVADDPPTVEFRLWEVGKNVTDVSAAAAADLSSLASGTVEALEAQGYLVVEEMEKISISGKDGYLYSVQKGEQRLLQTYFKLTDARIVSVVAVGPVGEADALQKRLIAIASTLRPGSGKAFGTR